MEGQEGKKFTIAEKKCHEQFKILVSTLDKGHEYSRVMHVEREDDGRFVYVCTDGIRMHILRTPHSFGFFERGKNYTFKVTSKTILFEETDFDRFPNWRVVYPKNAKHIAKAYIRREYRTDYLVGFYRAGIYIDLNFLACLELGAGAEYFVSAGVSSKAIVLKRKTYSDGFDFEAVIMPLKFVSAEAFVKQRGTK